MHKGKAISKIEYRISPTQNLRLIIGCNTLFTIDIEPACESKLLHYACSQNGHLHHFRFLWGYASLKTILTGLK